MLEMRAVVFHVDGDEAVVRVTGGGCGHCGTAGGCGGSALSRLFCSTKPRQFTVLNRVGARVGDEVQVSLPDGVLLRGALKMYVLPLVLLLAGGIAGASMAETGAGADLHAAAGALSGLLLGFIIARSLASGTASAVATAILSSR